MRPIRRVQYAIQNLDEVVPFFIRYLKSLSRLVSEAELEKIPLLVERAVGTNFLLRQQAIDSTERKLVSTEVLGNEMLVFAEDRGISRDLVINGIREERSTKQFIELLREVENKQEEPTVLDIGANIGYYVLIEASVLKSGAIYALEPEPDNFSLLERNIEKNGYSEKTDLEQAVIGRSHGTAELAISEHSNTHHIHESDDKIENSVISVDSYTVDTFLNEKGIAQEDIDVIRMDVEGYEVEIFDQLDAILKSNSSISIFVEIHHRDIGKSQYNQLLTKLEENGFEPYSAVYNTTLMPAWGGQQLDAASISNLRQLPDDANCLELIAYRE